MKRAALYVRVSTQEQKKYGLSVDNQISALKEYCKENGYVEVGLYNDAGISARKSYNKRPELLRLLEDCKAGKIDVILFTKLDRWFRSVADYYEIQRVLDIKHVTWRAIWEDYETDTSSGVFKVNIMLSVAQAEADRTSERIKAVNEYRREVKREYTSGKAATGYYVENSKLLIDPDKREGVSAFFKEYLTNFNMTAATKVLHSYGINVRRDTARRMLNNPTYYGDACGYKCDPYITKEEYDKIQSVLSGIKQRRTKYESRVYIFTGLLHCAECGAKMCATVRKVPCGKTDKIYKYYLCAKNRNMACNNTRSKTEMSIERELLQKIEYEMDQYNASVDLVETSAEENNKKIKSLNERISRIADLYEMGDITRDEYIDKKNKINREIADLNIVPIAKEKKALPDNWQEMYRSLPDIDKRAFWFNLLREIQINQNGDVFVKF